MPYKIRRLPKKNEYRVYNPETKEIHSYHTTLDNAKKQVRLLYMKLNEKMSGRGGRQSAQISPIPLNEDETPLNDDEIFYINMAIQDPESVNLQTIDNLRIRGRIRQTIYNEIIFLIRFARNSGGDTESESESETEIEGSGLPAGDLKELLKRSYNKTPSSFGDYILDKELSGQRGQVYWNEKMGKAVVVHRGTKGFQDMVTDLRYTLGDKSSKRFKKAKDIQNKANAKYGKDNVITAGHSLGSVLGETAVKDKDQELITLNKPVGLADIGKKISKRQTDIKTERDPVSILRGTQRGNKAMIIKSKTYNPLTEHSTETLERLSESDIIGEGFKNNLSNVYMPKISRDAEFVYIPQVKQQIFGTGVGSVKYGKNTGIVSSVHLKGRGGFYGMGIPAPPSRTPVSNFS